MFAKTKVISNSRSSSIVIRFDESRGVSEFQLPAGFENFPGDSYELKKELFFQTYHTYRKFIEEKLLIIKKQKVNIVDKTISEQDTVSETKEFFKFKDGVTGDVITYQKLVMFDSILDAYDELRIQSLQDKISKSESIDYSQIHKYLHQAVYLSNDVIFIDEVDLPKKIIKEAATELVELFCYIYSEILKEFGTESTNHKVSILANNFKEKRLFEESSLFSEDSYEDTLEILKEVLEEIDQTTPYKDFDYWHFYDAVHAFIYSNNDGTWSLDNFSFIWERMCLAFTNKYYYSQVALFDNFGNLSDSHYQSSIKSYFKVTMNPPESIVRFIRPDLVLKDPKFSIDDDFLEKLYIVKQHGREIDVTYNREIDYSNYSEVDALKKQLFKDKPKIKYFYQNAKKFPPTFTLSSEEYNDFKLKVKEALSKRNYFELAARQPKIVSPLKAGEDLNNFLVVDFKYMNESAFSFQVDSQILKTVKKQLIYELVLKLNRNANTRSEFWIPAYFPGRFQSSAKTVRKYSKNCDQFFSKYRISIIQLDFLTLQQIYIQDGI